MYTVITSVSAGFVLLLALSTYVNYRVHRLPKYWLFVFVYLFVLSAVFAYSTQSGGLMPRYWKTTQDCRYNLKYALNVMMEGADSIPQSGNYHEFVTKALVPMWDDRERIRHKSVINDHVKDYYFHVGKIKCPIHCQFDGDYHVNPIDALYAWWYVLMMMVVPLLMLVIGIIIIANIEKRTMIRHYQWFLLLLSVLAIAAIITPRTNSMILGVKEGAISEASGGCYDKMTVMKNVIMNFEEETGILPDSLWAETIRKRIPHQLDKTVCPSGGSYTYRDRRITCSVHGSPDFAAVPLPAGDASR